ARRLSPRSTPTACIARAIALVPLRPTPRIVAMTQCFFAGALVLIGCIRAKAVFAAGVAQARVAARRAEAIGGSRPGGQIARARARRSARDRRVAGERQAAVRRSGARDRARASQRNTRRNRAPV